jgi:hypothetical protein
MEPRNIVASFHVGVENTLLKTPAGFIKRNRDLSTTRSLGGILCIYSRLRVVAVRKGARMRRPHLLISGAWLLHGAAWFLPVDEGSVTFPQGLPGWQAFQDAACAVWPYERCGFHRWYDAVLPTASAATTPLFIFGSVWVVVCGSGSLRRASAWTATSAFILNAYWYVSSFGSDSMDLRIGYFLWWFSFLVLALGLFDLSRRTDNG